MGQAIMRLCSAKNRAQMTRFDLETWTAVLSVYPAAVANHAIVEMMLSPDPFPDLGKVVRLCQVRMAKTGQRTGPGNPEALTVRTIQQIAAALEIEINE